MKKEATVLPTKKASSVVTLDEIVASTAASAASPQVDGLFRTTVHARRDDGTIEVTVGEHGGAFLDCDVLETADMPADGLRGGDEVVVLPPARGQQRGCVLGRVRRQPGLLSEKAIPNTLLLEAGKELVLRVGEGSITLRADGKILIKGKDLVSHAKRMNRIRGGSVALN